jgi:glycosyltransferase involved in cell wall biosynthesis
MEKISVIIITKNEEDNIRDCLKSVDWADEIIVIDAESEDNTVEIARTFTDKIHIRKWQGYADQKKYALSLAENEWVLSIDADERVTWELKNEILNLRPDCDGYSIRRKNYFLSKEITSCGWDKDYQLRLFRKSKTEVVNKLVHEGFSVTGKVEQLDNVITHNTFSSIHNYLGKVNTYSSLKADELFKKNKGKVTRWTIFSHTFSAFFRYYISLKGFKDGMYGLIISAVNAISTLLNYTKLWELQMRGPSKKIV